MEGGAVGQLVAPCFYCSLLTVHVVPYLPTYLPTYLVFWAPKRSEVTFLSPSPSLLLLIINLISFYITKVGFN